MKKIRIPSIVALLLSMAGPTAAQDAPAALSPAATWYSAYLQNSKLVQLPDGRSLNLHCIGAGSPTVVLESGIGESAFTWWKVQDQIAKQTRVCAYDRAGLGRSPPGPLPRDTRSEVADLEALLPAAGIAGPYVLVGHSMGGYNIRLFASRHLDDVAGIVLVDPSVENQVPILEKAVPEIARQDKIAISRAQACADPDRTQEIAKLCVRPAPEDFPADLAEKFVAAQGLAASQTFHSEVESFLNVASEQVIAERRSFGDVPLIVLTRGELSTNMPKEQAETEWKLWNEMHDEVAKLSTRGTHRVVTGAGHYIQIDRQDAVVEAVKETISEKRAN